MYEENRPAPRRRHVACPRHRFCGAGASIMFLLLAPLPVGVWVIEQSDVVVVGPTDTKTR